MATKPMSTTQMSAAERAADSAAVYAEGIRAGLVGAAAIAVWFLIVDSIFARPLYTPNLLGTALLRHMASLNAPETIPISFETVVTFTFFHVLAFILIGMAAAQLVSLAEHNANFGFGIVLLFVLFEFGFLAASAVFAQPLLRALAWPAVVVGNLLAAAAMAAVFWRRHPRLDILP